MKTYYISVDGKEMVKSSIFPGDIIGSLSSAHAKEASTFNLVALEAGVVVEIDFERLYNNSQDGVQLLLALYSVRRAVDFFTPALRCGWPVHFRCPGGVVDD